MTQYLPQANEKNEAGDKSSIFCFDREACAALILKDHRDRPARIVHGQT